MSYFIPEEAALAFRVLHAIIALLKYKPWGDDADDED